MFEVISYDIEPEEEFSDEYWGDAFPAHPRREKDHFLASFNRMVGDRVIRQAELDFDGQEDTVAMSLPVGTHMLIDNYETGTVIKFDIEQLVSLPYRELYPYMQFLEYVKHSTARAYRFDKSGQRYTRIQGYGIVMPDDLGRKELFAMGYRKDGLQKADARAVRINNQPLIVGVTTESFGEKVGCISKERLLGAEALEDYSKVWTKAQKQLGSTLTGRLLRLAPAL